VSTVPTHAVVICTRNRPADVETLLGSLSAQKSEPFVVLVVDASDPDEAREVRFATERSTDIEVTYVPYQKSPSLARQRNFGVGQLPSDVEIVHFLDDDVTLEPGYLEVLRELLHRERSIGGAGGLVLDERWNEVPKWSKRVAALLFLLEPLRPGTVLPYGGLIGPQSVDLTEPTRVQFLGGCASYRRELISRFRFDERLEGYSMDEDLDFSYRVGRSTELVVHPEAKLHHRVSPVARHSIRESRRDLLVHRYWFVEKNLKHPLRKPAFWWKIFGSYLMASLSKNPDAREAKMGIEEGARMAWTRTHPLLRR